ncbi:hypothetical protein DD779_03575 [Helicobacter pylori]|nr:hypothetical protein DD779_03575 [Helicobacter pylori]
MFFKNPLNDPNYFKPENAKNTPQLTRENMLKNFGLLNYSKTSYSDFVNDYKPTPKTSKFSNFMENIGGYGGLGMLGGAIGGLGSLIVGAINFSEQNKSAKESARMAKEQFELEKQRYNARDEAKAMTEWGARSKEENTARISQAQETILNSLKKNMQMLESLGGNVSPLVLSKMKEYQDKLNYIDEMSGKIDLKKYQILAGGGS